jgi:hypothetical protein
MFWLEQTDGSDRVGVQMGRISLIFWKKIMSNQFDFFFKKNQIKLDLDSTYQMNFSDRIGFCNLYFWLNVAWRIETASHMTIQFQDRTKLIELSNQILRS